MKTNEFDLLCWFDGSCGPINPGGTGGWGYLIKNVDGNVLDTASGQLPANPRMTNNVAEYHAVANLFEAIDRLRISRGWTVRVYGDSQMVIRQLTGKIRARKGCYLAEYKRARQNLIALATKQGVLIDLVWIPREENSEADALSTSRSLSRV